MSPNNSIDGWEIVKRLPDALGVADHDGQFLWVSVLLSHRLGSTNAVAAGVSFPGCFLQTTWSQHVGPGWERARAGLRTVSRLPFGPCPQSGLLDIAAPQARWFDLHLIPLRPAADGLHLVLILLRDVTEHAQLEDEAARAKRTSEFLEEEFEGLYLETDGEGRIQELNKSAAAYFRPGALLFGDACDPGSATADWKEFVTKGKPGPFACKFLPSGAATPLFLTWKGRVLRNEFLEIEKCLIMMRDNRREQIGEAVVDELELTGRESEVVRLVFEGLPNQSIADQLGISEKTVKVHLSSIYRKAGVPNRGDLILRFMK